MPPNPFTGFYGQSRGARLFRRGKTPVALGPWPQGLYNAGPIQDVPNGFFNDVLNLDVMQNGVLVARRGFHDLDCGGGRTSPVVSILGDAWESGQQYTLIQRTSSGSLTELLSLKTSTPTVYSTTFTDRVFTSAVKYGSNVYFVSSTAAKSVVATTALGAVTLATSANIPAGDLSSIVKDRMFVVNKSTSRIYYSKATDPTTWTAPDGGFFDVDPGNGQNITSVMFVGNSIYIFKSGATYLFTFTIDPGVDGYLRKIADVGADDAVYFEGDIFVINKTGFYRIVNTSFEILSQNIDISLMANPRLWRIRELIILNNSNLSINYVFNSRTRIWTKYDNTVSDTTRPNKMFSESFETSFGQRLTWVTRGSSGVLASFNTNVPANGNGENRDYHLGDSSTLGIAPTYRVQTGLISPGQGMRLSRLQGVNIDVTAKYSHNNQFGVTLAYTGNSSKLLNTSLVADVPNHGDTTHDGISWSGALRAYNPTPDTPVGYRIYSTGVSLQYTSNSEDSVFNFEIRNIYALISQDTRELDTSSTIANS